MEVERALSSDPLYGPKHDRQRNTIGLEYEVVLEDMLRAMGEKKEPIQLYGCVYPNLTFFLSLLLPQHAYHHCRHSL